MKKKKKIKILKQNEKSKLFNRRYKGKIKIFLKLLKAEVFQNVEIVSLQKIVKFSEIFSMLTSILDRAAQKKAIHKNKNAKKKSSLQKKLKSFQ